MNAGPAAAPDLPWGLGDTTTIIIALLTFGFSVFYHRKAFKRLKHDFGPLAIELMATSLSFGPLLMILADPFSKFLPFFRIDLLDIVINESRITLWLSAFITCVTAGASLVRPR